MGRWQRSRGTRFAQAAGNHIGKQRTTARGDGSDVPRNPWRAKAMLIGAVAAGVICGILVGMLLVHLLLAPNSTQP